MIDVGELPDLAHRDPTDRMLIATARAHDLILVTRDRAILAYAAAGHVRAVAC
jgi:PIN domain nuclease of toxin-antitoxin system